FQGIIPHRVNQWIPGFGLSYSGSFNFMDISLSQIIQNQPRGKPVIGHFYIPNRSRLLTYNITSIGGMIFIGKARNLIRRWLGSGLSINRLGKNKFKTIGFGMDLFDLKRNLPIPNQSLQSIHFWTG